MSLYRRRTFQASVAVVLVLAWAIAAAQRHKPHKLRATSLAELTTDNKGTVTAHLIPVTILDEGVFRDATMYKATPVPMALDSGVVYEAQKSGEIVGYVTVIGAAKDKSGGWAALGKWQPPSAPKPAATPAPAAADERPRLHRGDGSASASASANTPTSTASPSPAPSSSPTPSPSPTAISAAQQPPPEDPNRPVLRRGRPEPQAVSSSSPAAPAPPSASASSKSPATTAARLSAAPGTQMLVAVSDTQSTDIRSYEFAWKKGEQEEMEAKLRRLALTNLPREGPLNDRSLTHIAIRSLDLDLSNEAVMVLTAEIPRRTSPRYLTLIARVDMEGKPQQVAVSITDASRLDVTPRLELIDAVDVDGDGVAELLFRQYSFDAVSYVVFSVGRSTVSKVFEGASTPLK
jgi:hypothetical protein